MAILRALVGAALLLAAFGLSTELTRLERHKDEYEQRWREEMDAARAERLESEGRDRAGHAEVVYERARSRRYADRAHRADVYFIEQSTLTRLGSLGLYAAGLFVIHGSWWPLVRRGAKPEPEASGTALVRDSGSRVLPRAGPGAAPDRCT